MSMNNSQETLTINSVSNNVGINQGVSGENNDPNIVAPNINTPVNNMVEPNTLQVNDIVDKDMQEALTINSVPNNVGTNQEILVGNNAPNVVVPSVNIPVNNQVQSNTPQVNDIVDKDIQEALTINPVSNNVGTNQGISVESGVPNVVTPNINIPISNSAEPSIPRENMVGYNNMSAPVINSIDNNIPNFNNFNTPVSDIGETSGVVEIPTVSMDSVLGDNNTNTINDASDGVDELITNFVGDNTEVVNNSIDANITNNTNAGTNTETLVTENAKPKKKKKKALFIILLIITILIVAAVGVLSYFMFFKADKLVCGNQDYSQPQYMLDESMVMNFKGNTLTNTNLNQRITFNNDYLEELKNQYQGLGFNVSFVENEDGFDITMNFTKKELEAWYGTSLKNSSKSQMKKEMRESGYTCK